MLLVHPILAVLVVGMVISTACFGWYYHRKHTPRARIRHVRAGKCLLGILGVVWLLGFGSVALAGRPGIPRPAEAIARRAKGAVTWPRIRATPRARTTTRTVTMAAYARSDCAVSGHAWSKSWTPKPRSGAGFSSAAARWA